MNVTIYILIGGRSTRFGSNKALAEIAGKTLAERARDIVRRALPESPVFFVAGDSTSLDSDRLDEPTIHDEVEDCGPIGGLHAALSNAKSEWIFLFACDLPLMTSEFIAQLREECIDDVDAVVPEQPDGRMQPLCAFYRVAAALPAVEEIIATKPNAAMLAVIDRLKTRIVRSVVDEIWANVNRSRDLAEIARKLSHVEPI